MPLEQPLDGIIGKNRCAGRGSWRALKFSNEPTQGKASAHAVQELFQSACIGAVSRQSIAAQDRRGLRLGFEGQKRVPLLGDLLIVRELQ